MIKKRDIAICIILSIVTCGIYWVYWFVTLTDDVNQVSGEPFSSGGVAILLTFITCGIYGIYWAYRMGQNMGAAKQKRGIQTGGTDMGIVYLILHLVGLNIIALALIQNELNAMNDDSFTSNGSY